MVEQPHEVSYTARFEQQLQQPPIEYRLTPFWFWNGMMCEEEIAHQIREMAAQGVGGFFICATQGLEIPYLSDLWLQRVRYAVEIAHELGMHAWLYDEYPYPSGMSGGDVTLEHPETRQRTLEHRAIEVGGPLQSWTYTFPWGVVLSAHAVPINADAVPNWSAAIDIAAQIGNSPSTAIFQETGLTIYTHKRFFTADMRKTLAWDVPPGRWLISVFLECEIGNFKYFGTYVDPCHPVAVRTFLHTTHERYARVLGAYLGTTVPGIFTDEVGLLSGIPWTAQLPDFFREQYGDNLLAHLDRFLYHEADIETCSRLRYQVFQSIHHLLSTVYHQQVRAWCDHHHLAYTADVPSVRMTTQRYCTIPGGDSAHEKVGRSLSWIIDRYSASMRANPKWVSSLMRQLGKTRSMIECFHSVGWTMTLQDARVMLDRMAALGINQFIFHAFYYSVDGLRKHHAAPSHFLQTPAWPHFHHLADYAARLSYVMSQGNATIALAIVDPTTTFWTHLGNPFHDFAYCGLDEEERERLRLLMQDWKDLCRELLLRQIDYDHLDPELLASGTIEHGQLHVGSASYQVLLLPPLTNLEGAARRRIAEFLQQGGTVISVGLLPYENIDDEQPDLAEMRGWFGLSGDTQRSYWRGERPDEEAGRATQHTGAWFIPCTAGQLQAQALESLYSLLDRYLAPLVRVEAGEHEHRSLLMQHRVLEDGAHLLFLSNQEGEERVLRLHLASPLVGHTVQRLDLCSGQASLVQDVCVEEQRTSLPLVLAPYEAQLLRFSEQHVDTPIVETPWSLIIAVRQPWEVHAMGKNVLRLADFHINFTAGLTDETGPWYMGTAAQHWPRVGVKPFIQQCAECSDQQSFPLHFTQDFGLAMRVGLPYPLCCRYVTTFVVQEHPASCHLLLERSAIGGQYQIFINGVLRTQEQCTPTRLYDQHNLLCDISELLTVGRNVVAVQVEVVHDSDGIIEPLYLLGDFGVEIDERGQLCMVAPPVYGQPCGSSAVQPGYPYYSGTLSFRRSIDLEHLPETARFIVTLSGWERPTHDCVEVWINQHSLSVCCWSPYNWQGTCDILDEGSNEVEIRITNTLAPMLDGEYFDDVSHRIVSVQ